MRSELVVDVQPQEVSIALLEDGRLMSLQKEKRDVKFAVGDIYYGRIKKLMPGLNAAFVDIGSEKDAFLHYLDLGSQFSSFNTFVQETLAEPQKAQPITKVKLQQDLDKQGSISTTLTVGQKIVVQVAKEPISTKGPRLTTELTFTGRYMVLIPFSNKVSISQKIKSTQEKMRLRQLVESIRPKNFGVIIRTSAEDKRVAELNNEMSTLMKCWDDMVEKLKKSEMPALLHEEDSRAVGVIRDLFSPSFESIHVNDAEVYSQIYNYVSLIAPERKETVKLYAKDEPIFDSFNVTKQIKSSFGKAVSFKSGAYIIIEHTEALHVIDVNSGNRNKNAENQEENAIDVNLRAADEIARQLRLRDMGGIIVIDFIDMNTAEHRQKLYDHMREVMANDRARHNILPLSKFGLMQITRQRVRAALDIETLETCPSCYGKGLVQPSILFTDRLREKLDYVVNTLGKQDFVLYVHPYVYAYIKQGLFSSIYRKWRGEFGKKFKVVANQALAFLEYKFIDSDRKEIDVTDNKDSQQSSEEKKASKSKRATKLRKPSLINKKRSEQASVPKGALAFFRLLEKIVKKICRIPTEMLPLQRL